MDLTTGAIILSILLGMIGGAAHLLVDATCWGDCIKFPMLKKVALGAIVGGLYLIVRREWNFPDGVMTFITGYMGVDFILGLIEQGKKIISKKSTDTKEE